jgi:hypothetical protein
MNDNYSLMEAEAALCVWEYLLEQRHFVSPEKVTPVGLGCLWDTEGTCAVRLLALDLGVAIERAYVNFQTAHPDLGDGLGPFDWEVVPAIVAQCTVVDSNLFPPSEPEIFEILTGLAQQQDLPL